MSIFQRIKALFQSGVSGAADELEDPRRSLDYSLVRLEQSQNEINRSLVEVAAARQRLAEQYNRLGAGAEKYQEQARAALDVGREDLARLAIERKQVTQARQAEMETNLSGLDQQLDSLKASQANLARKIAMFRSRKEELAAVYDASKAQVRLQESLTGISRDLSDVGHTIQRAEERIMGLRSRVAAIDQLVDQGVLTDVLEGDQDEVDRELLRLNRSQAVEDELALLKRRTLPDQGSNKLLEDKNEE